MLTLSSLTACTTTPGTTVAKQLPSEKKLILTLTEEKLESTLIKGKTTKKEVREKFGEPEHSAVVDEHSVKWVYLDTDSQARDTGFLGPRSYDNKIVVLSIILKDGIVCNYDLNIKTKISPREIRKL